MKHRDSKDGVKFDNINKFSKKKKNIQRLGGTGLSLEAFANAKSMNNHYNPAFKKKQREFYKNAKCVSKYKKLLNQQSQPNDISSSVRPIEDQSQTENGNKRNIKNRKKKKPKMEELYENKREEEEKARIEKEAIFQAKKEGREKAEARRKATREKMFKKTRYGQPLMKYRIEHLLETIQGSGKNSVNNNT
ncbi:hypothetical protein JRO89_XS01G0378700 [Xanthoceras sorbifolium]|uniref:rRNA-processing protein FYV7 n=1 Tax=Xanthoceras sorbifolium TaxID=99658 RepID=A0ABQ8IPQ8_9ROSI|nr:hypothetical protein JRO89_XS01G0378700 [Xanthoceras sorbifolium]